MAENLPDTNVGNIDYISRQAAIDAAREGGKKIPTLAIRIMHDIKAIPTADVVQVVHGKWTKLFYDSFNCNKCGSTFVIMQGRNNMYYCPNCGAKMDAQGEE